MKTKSINDIDKQCGRILRWLDATLSGTRDINEIRAIIRKGDKIRDIANRYCDNIINHVGCIDWEPGDLRRKSNLQIPREIYMD